MAIKIVKAVNLINLEVVTTSTTSESYYGFSTDDSNYNGSMSKYFEAVCKYAPGDAEGGTCFIITDEGSWGITYTETNYTRKRLDISDKTFSGGEYRTSYRIRVSGTFYCKAARLLILQDAGEALTATESQFEIGNYETCTATSYSPLAYPKYFTYAAANWDGTCNWYAEVVYAGEDVHGIEVYVRLEEDDGSWANWAEKVVLVSAGTAVTPTRVRVAFTPTDGRHYRLAGYTSDAKDEFYIYCGKTICVQTGTITKTECPLLLVNTNQTGTGLQDFDGYYDPADWDGVTANAYHEIACAGSAANAKLQSDPNGSPADVPNSAVIGEANKMVRGGTAMTMPETAEEIDTNITSAGDLTMSRIVWLVEVSGGGYTLDVGSGSYAETGTLAGLLRNAFLAVAAGSYAETGFATTLAKGYKIIPGAGSYAEVGTTTALLRNALLVPAVGAFAETGITAGLFRNTYILVGSGAYTEIGQVASLLKKAGLSAIAGSYAESGVPAALLKTWLVPVAAGAYTESGQITQLLKASGLTVGSGSYVLTGFAADLVYEALGQYYLAVNSGDYTLVGQIASLLKSWLASITSGAYAEAGQAASLLRNALLASGTGVYDEIGQSVSLLKHSGLQALLGDVVLTGQPSSLLRFAKLICAAGGFLETGLPADLIYTPGVEEEFQFRRIIPLPARAHWRFPL